ncbi:MAG: hypothetical protein VX911_10695 [Candidatus Latescibacterota bacterium]|nr:hypothetical protein [Candidatus Latescibacterota bacterium]
MVDEVKASGLLGYNQIPWAPSLRLAGGSYLYRITANGDEGIADAEGVVQVVR